MATTRKKVKVNSTEMKKTINNTSHCVSLRRWQPKS